VPVDDVGREGDLPGHHEVAEEGVEELPVAVVLSVECGRRLHPPDAEVARGLVLVSEGEHVHPVHPALGRG
jgi:hypothetical protein